MQVLLKLLLCYVGAIMHLGMIWIGFYLFYPQAGFIYIFIAALGVSNAIWWRISDYFVGLAYQKPKILDMHIEKTVEETKPKRPIPPTRKGKKHSPETIEKLRKAAFAREAAKRAQKARFDKTQKESAVRKARKATAKK